jgi:hypothetical protein
MYKHSVECENWWYIQEPLGFRRLKPMVASCNTKFNSRKFYILPTQRICVCVCFFTHLTEQTAIMPLYNIN